MTDTSSVIATHSTTEPFPVTAPSQPSPLPNGSLSDTNLQDDEDYTIKCICSYADDDGNTVLCEKCDTWQHIECYYKLYGKEVPEVHLCTDCLPQELDPKRATERQKRRREQSEGGDRKVKRPVTKSHKKKHKDSITAGDQVNGWHLHDRHDSLHNGRDSSHPSKKPKTSHRTSASVASVNGHPTGESRKRAFSNLQSYPSPSKSPQDHFRFPSIPLYTPEFLELYDRDEGTIVGNEWTNPITVRAASNFQAVKDQSSLQSNGASPLTYSDRPLEPDVWPPISLEPLKNTGLEIDGRHPTWRLLKAESDIWQEDLVGEIKGEIGSLEEYTDPKSSSNRWNELYHPDSFVFFHPNIEIFIDSRRHGTKFRYLRRSCRPNVKLKTFITTNGTAHHCFVASRNIPAGEELTTAWYLNPGYFPKDSRSLNSEDLRAKQIAWTSRVLANFGDCACDRSQPCHLANLDRRTSTKVTDPPQKQTAGRKKKTKTKNAVSPLSTGQATNSRAGSETVKGPEEDDQFDRRSTSTSSHSYQSRDVTPAGTAMLDAPPVLGEGLTARERRKIAALEEAFKKQQQEPHDRKKKKRTSGGSTLNTPNASASKQLGLQSNSNPSTPSMMQPQSDLRPFRPLSGSPPPLRPYSRHDPIESPCRPGSSKSASNSFASPRSSYVSIGIQTDPETPDIPEMPPCKRRKFSTPTQRLLRRVLEDRAKWEQQGSSQLSVYSAVNVGHEVSAEPRKSSDVEMEDAPTSSTPVAVLQPSPLISPVVESRGPTRTAISPPLSMPSQAAHSHKSHAVPWVHQKLHLSTLPPVPAFAGPPSAPTTAPGSATTNVVTPSTAQSPMSFASGAASFPGLGPIGLTSPSPARKKLSLGDYTRRRHLAATPTTEKTQAQGGLSLFASTESDSNALTSEIELSSSVMVKPDDSIKEEAATIGEAASSAVDDTPLKEDEEDYSPPDVTPGPDDTMLDVAKSAEPDDSATSVPAGQPVESAKDTTTPPAGPLPPEVQNVLAQLQNLQTPQTEATAGDDTATS